MRQGKAFLSGILVKQSYLLLPRSPFPFAMVCYLYLSLKILYYYFVHMVILSACMSEHRVVCLVPKESRRGDQIPWIGVTEL